MLISYKDNGHKRSVLKTLFNKRHRRGRSVVKNAFGLLKESWQILLNRCDLNVKIILDVFVSCYILHNLLLDREEVDVKELMWPLVLEFDNDVPVRRIRPKAVPVFNPNAQMDFVINLVDSEVAGIDNHRAMEAFLGAQPQRA